jgi:fructokinase
MTNRPRIKRRPNVVGLGEVLWDMLPSGRRPGGAPANFAFHAMCLGADAAPVSAVGEDGLGDELLALLEKAGLDTGFVARDPDHPTGTVDVRLEGPGAPEYTIHENAAWDHIPFTPRLEELARGTRAACFGTLARRSPVSAASVFAFLEAMPAGGLRLFDVNLRQGYYGAETVHEGLVRAEALKLNDAELPELRRLFSLPGTTDAALSALIDGYRLKFAALTLGEKGSRLVGPEFDSFLPAPTVRIADTVGAGDAFAAALAVGWLDGLPVDAIHENAVRIASFVCTRQGAMPDPSEALSGRPGRASGVPLFRGR